MSSGVTMSDIAKRLGVSKTTVSLALANQPGVSEEMRQSVIDMAARLGYQRRDFPLSISTRRRAILAVFQNNLIQSDISGLAIWYIDGVQAAADDFKLRVVLSTLAIGERIADHAIDVARSEPVDMLGALLMGVKERTEPVVNQLQALGIPIVAVNRHWPESDLSFVSVDYRRAQMEAVRYLWQMGHRTIAYVSIDADEGYSWLKQRREGYEAGLVAEGGVLNPRHVIHAPDVRQVVDNVLDNAADATAICAQNDTLALALIRELQQRAIIVPRDMSVIGFDNDRSLPISDPPLTTIGSDPFDIGYQAVRILVEQATKDEIERVQVTVRTRAGGARKLRSTQKRAYPAFGDRRRLR